VNSKFLRQLSERLQASVGLEGVSALLEGRDRAQRASLAEAEAWFCVQLGDHAFGAEGVEGARGWYDKGRRACPSAFEPWVGLAQVAAAHRQDGPWLEAITALRAHRGEIEDPVIVVRAEGLLATHDMRHGVEHAERTWRQSVDTLLEADCSWSAWHLQMAGGLAMISAGASPDAEHAYAAALQQATISGLERAVLWSSLSLSWLVKGSGRVAEAEECLSACIQAAEALGDSTLLDAALALGCDLAAELAQANLLVDRLRLRAGLAGNEGRGAARLDFLYQGFTAAFRAREPYCGSLGEEFVEAFLSSGDAWGDAVDMQELIGALVSVEALDHAIQLVVCLSQREFSRGHQVDAATWLAEAARLALHNRDASQAAEMFEEAIQVSKVYRLDIHGGWAEEMVACLGYEP
jgi:hypothetical protein